MTYLVFLSPVLFLISVITAFYLNKTRLYYLLLDAHHSQLFVPQSQIHTRAQIYLPTPIEENRLIPADAVKEAIAALSSYIDRTRPDWIAGINIGGRLLSVYVVHQLNWSSDKCLFIRPSYDKNTWEIEADFSSVPDNKIRNKIVGGKLLIIDDIMRTGRTLANVRSFIVNISFSNGYDLDRVIFATLLEEVPEDDEVPLMHPDWSWRLTRHRYMKFPWCKLSSDVRVMLDQIAAANPLEWERLFKQELFHEYRKIASSYAYTLMLAEQYLDKSFH